MKSEKERGWAAIAFYSVLFGSLVLVICVVTPRIGSDPKNAKKMAAEADLADIGKTLESFNSDCGRYPTTAEGLQALVVQPSGSVGWKGPYPRVGVPPDPWGHAYVYKSPGDHNRKTFDLCSFGPNGQEGGGDDFDNWTKE